MRKNITASVLVASLLVVALGCQPTQKGSVTGDTQQKAAPQVKLTAENNPTALAGRGVPDLDDWLRPAAWIYIDGHAGRFLEVDGNPQGQWTIGTPVGPNPTFRVEAYAPLLGSPRDFSCVLQPVNVDAPSTVTYVFSAVKGTFRTDQTYSLLKPGKNFTIRNYTTGDVVLEIPPLSPGTYLLAAGIKNKSMGSEGHAVTYFTVQ